MNPRTPVEELRLKGGANLRRALDREKNDLEKPPLTPEQEGELAKVDALIAQAMKCCKRGQVFNGRRNPAFANLAELVRVRKILEGRAPSSSPQSAKDILAEAEKLMGVN